MNFNVKKIEFDFDEVVKDIKEYANSKFKKPMGDRNVN